MNLQMDIFRRYYALTDKFTDGLNPSVLPQWPTMYWWISSVGIPNSHRQVYRRYESVGMSHYHRRDKSVGIFQAKNFFWRAISVCKTIGKCFFFIFPTDIATNSGITDERKADGRIPSLRMSVNKLSTKS